MKTAEKNDVDISKLFAWGREVTIVDSIGEDLFTVFMRVVGDAEINQARVYALRKSAELRKKLKIKDSDERLAFIPELDEVETENIIELILNQSIKDLASKIVKEIQFPLPKELKSDTTLEEEEKYQKEVDEWPEKRELFISEKIQQRLEVEREKLKKQDKKELIKEFENILINNMCESEMIKSFTEMSAYFSVYKTDSYKERVFNSVEEFSNLPSNIKEQFIRNYESLDIRADDLKKLRGVMP